MAEPLTKYNIYEYRGSFSRYDQGSHYIAIEDLKSALEYLMNLFEPTNAEKMIKIQNEFAKNKDTENYNKFLVRKVFPALYEDRGE